MKPLSLFELNNLVRSLIDQTFKTTYWLSAELSEVSERHRHCYVEFVQKQDGAGNLLARARGQIWANRWVYIAPYFLRVTGRELSVGMQVLVQVQVTFHELYGYSLTVIDIDPVYTLGDIARRRQEILRVLHDEGIDTMNKDLPLPPLLQRVAIISSPAAAGYEDFCNQLHSNPFSLAFHTELFPAIMQGNEVEQSVIHALDAIAQSLEQWDVVAIIRGGGASSDLSGFDTLALAENVAQFPLPIITGIGHERDDTVIDLVAHTRLKTPTAAAAFIVNHQRQQLEQVNMLADRLSTSAVQAIVRQTNEIRLLTSRLPSIVFMRQSREVVHLGRLAQTLQHAAIQYASTQRGQVDLKLHTLRSVLTSFWKTKHANLQLAQQTLATADPIRILRLGYSITRLKGKALQTNQPLLPGDLIETQLAEGTIQSVVKKTYS